MTVQPCGNFPYGPRTQEDSDWTRDGRIDSHFLKKIRPVLCQYRFNPYKCDYWVQRCTMIIEIIPTVYIVILIVSSVACSLMNLKIYMSCHA